MGNYRERLDALFERKERSISEMDSFQIVKEIEKTIIELLRVIFAPYPIKTVDEKVFTHAPDGLLRFLPLGRKKNWVFLEIKARKIATFDFKVIREMIKELKANYPLQFHSLLIVTKIVDDELISRLSKEFYPDKVEIASIDALLDIAGRLSVEPQLETPECRESFLTAVMGNEILSSNLVRDLHVPIPLKEYRFEKVTGRMMTRDNFGLEMCLSLRVDVQDRRLSMEIIGGAYGGTADKMQAFVLSAIGEDVRRRTLFDFVSMGEKIHSDMQNALASILTENGLKLLDLELTWEFDPKTRSVAERSRHLVDERDQVRREIKDVQSILSDTYANLLTKIGTFNRNLDRLTENYSRGEITEKSYEQDMKKLQEEVVALKEKVSPPKMGN